MPWGAEHIIFCEVMHWGLGFFVGLSVYLLTLTMLYGNCSRTCFPMGDSSTHRFSMVPASCLSLIPYVSPYYLLRWLQTGQAIGSYPAVPVSSIPPPGSEPTVMQELRDGNQNQHSALRASK